MKGIFRALKYVGVIIIILECVRSAFSKVSEQYPELIDQKNQTHAE